MPSRKDAAGRGTVKLPTTTVEIERRGRGRPLVLLHGEDGHELDLPLIDALAARHEVILPRMPRFGKSTLPDHFRTIDDVAYCWLDLLDALALKDATLVGFSAGGWLAAEMAVKDMSRIGRLVLVGAVGCKFGGAYDREIEDIWFHPVERVRAFRFHDPDKDPHADMTKLSKREALAVARQREAIAKLCWEPYFHNPALRHRSHRISAPTLVVWGAKDGMTAPRYGRAYARHIPGAQFVSISNAGHFPHIEQPEKFRAVLDDFLACPEA